MRRFGLWLYRWYYLTCKHDTAKQLRTVRPQPPFATTLFTRRPRAWNRSRLKAAGVADFAGPLFGSIGQLGELDEVSTGEVGETVEPEGEVRELGERFSHWSGEGSCTSKGMPSTMAMLARSHCGEGHIAQHCTHEFYGLCARSRIIQEERRSIQNGSIGFV